jgi:hypothetical protein
MELAEKIDSINRQLVDFFGIDTVSGDPMWRVAWSEDQFEYRLGTYDDYTPGGLYIRTVTEVRYVPKYRQWIKEKYVLEQLVIVPEVNAGDLPGVKISYEPMWTFQDNFGNYLSPTISACQFIINLILESKGKNTFAKYKDPLGGLTTEEQIEVRDQQINDLQKDLFGNETDAGDALAHGEAIVVPRNYQN